MEGERGGRERGEGSGRRGRGVVVGDFFLVRVYYWGEKIVEAGAKTSNNVVVLNFLLRACTRISISVH